VEPDTQNESHYNSLKEKLTPITDAVVMKVFKSTID